MFSGTITAMVTPFIDGKLDEQGLCHNIEYQLNAGVSGLLVLGTTGELLTLTPAEQHRVIEAAVEEVKGAVPVIVNAGDGSTHTTIERVKQAEELGADGLLIVTPYYNKPPQAGIVRHFEAVARETSLPIIVYNNPTRTGVALEPETIPLLAGIDGVVAIKDSSASISFASSIEGMTFLSGDDIMTLPLMAIGAKGVISVISNLVPEMVVTMVSAALSGDFDTAGDCHKRLHALCCASGVESNPMPIKYAMNLVGLPAGETRLPLCELKPASKRIIEQAVEVCAV